MLVNVRFLSDKKVLNAYIYLQPFYLATSVLQKVISFATSLMKAEAVAKAKLERLCYPCCFMF